MVYDLTTSCHGRGGGYGGGGGGGGYGGGGFGGGGGGGDALPEIGKVYPGKVRRVAWMYSSSLVSTWAWL